MTNLFQMTSEGKTMKLSQDELFIQGVTQLADKYGMKIDIDFDNYHINLSGEASDEVALAQELEEMFGKYAC